MKKYVILITILFTTSIGYFLYKNLQGFFDTNQVRLPLSMIEKDENKPASYSARFFIFTNGTKRVFDASMYHNRSPEIFLESNDPSIIQIKKEEATWQDFFSTLPTPFRLTEKCLITGTNEEYCSGANGTLRFYLNKKRLDDPFNIQILDKDELLVSFGMSETNLKNELNEF